jgi:hypothetical protein
MDTKKLVSNKYFNLEIFWVGVLFGIFYDNEEKEFNIIFLCFRLEINLWEMSWKGFFKVLFYLILLVSVFSWMVVLFHPLFK